MIILHGTRLYGKVDQVPGLFHVATQFFYLQFIPLFPLASYLVFDGTGRDDGGFAGRKIGFHGRSIFFAYARLALFLGGCTTAIIGFIDAVEMLDRRRRPVDWTS